MDTGVSIKGWSIQKGAILSSPLLGGWIVVVWTLGGIKWDR